MNKKVIIVVIVGMVVVFGYFFVREKPNIFAPILKLSTSIIFQETGGGCGDIFVYKINNDHTASISVSANKEKLNFSTTEKTFEIGKSDGLRVEIRIGEKYAHFYCTDVLPPTQLTIRKLFGKSGKAIISISDVDKSKPQWIGNYTATVILKDIHFVDDKGIDSDIVVDELIFKDVGVGWYPG